MNNISQISNSIYTHNFAIIKGIGTNLFLPNLIYIYKFSRNFFWQHITICLYKCFMNIYLMLRYIKKDLLCMQKFRNDIVVYFSWETRTSTIYPGIYLSQGKRLFSTPKSNWNISMPSIYMKHDSLSQRKSSL